MYKTFTLPLKSALALAALFILAACGGFTIDINLPANTDCFANPFVTECDEDEGVDTYRKTVISNCADNPNRADSEICRAADIWDNPPSDDENGAEGAVADITPKKTEVKIEFDKDSLTKTDKEKAENTGLEIVDLCSDPATAGDERCTAAVIDCINRPFSGSCQGDNLLGNFVRGDVTVSKTVVLQDKRAEDCRTGRIDRSLCQNLNTQKQRCAGAAFSTDAICTSVAHSVCKADAFDPLCGEKEDLGGVYFNERSEVCFEDPNNPNCSGTNGHVAVVCSEYPFDRLCTDNTDYDVARANACESDPTISSSCPVVDVCLDNPFGPTCADSDYNNARKELVKTCVIQAVTGAATSACDTIINSVGSCFIDPFSTDCDENPAVRSYIAQLRSNRVALCNSNLRVAAYCTGAPVAKSVCRIDPFDTVCIGDNDYADARLSACRDGSASAGQCGAIITGVCRDNPFDALCGNGYTGERETACRNGSATTGQCRDTVAGICSGNPFDTLCGSGYTLDRRNACSGDPFAPRCAGDVYNDLRVSFCEDNVGTHPSCPAPETTITEVTAGVWADSFDEELETTITRGSTSSKFLKARATDLDNGGVGVLAWNYLRNSGNLNLADATFNGTALGGDRTDGAAFFAARYANDGGLYSYAGVLSGTNLGAPLTDTQGSAKWVGSFVYEGRAPIDFVLNVSFGTGAGAGEVEALVQKYRIDDYHLKGEFDDAGVITGTANRGKFRTNDPANRGFATRLGTLTGLIGEEGAVGAFLIGNFFGGFVARPSSVEELRTLAQTCADDPFNALCTVGYEAERVARIEECIIGGNPDNPSLCWNAMKLNSCIGNPFADECRNEFADYYQQARDNRVTFCRTTGNETHHLCADGYADVYICTNHPFDTQCLGNNDYTSLRRDACSIEPFATRCAGDVYNDLRVTFCENNADNPACPQPTPQVTAEVWAGSFDTPLAHGATADDTKSQFLIGRETDLDTGGRRPLISSPHPDNYLSNLNLADATFNGVALGGDAADGVGLFAAERANNGRYYSYAGVLSGTNLGAPLTDTEGSAKWIGSFKIEGRSSTDFVLNISFGAGAGEIEALVQHSLLPDYHIAGEFDDTGVITGTARHGTYRTSDPDDDRVLNGATTAEGTLTGLIGEEGAVGAFLIGNWFGGFVARPTSTAELRTLEQTCADDPFNQGCTIGYESERNAVLDHCIIVENANDPSCRSASVLYTCISNPFLSTCKVTFPSHYQQALNNRVTFCRTSTENSASSLCTARDASAYICTNYPFDVQCIGDNDYDQAREDACTTAGTGSTECQALAGLNCGTNPFHSYCDSGYNDARERACNFHPGQQRCADTIERICNGNPFGSLCRNTTVYLNARKTHCRRAWNDPRCPATIRAVCGVDPFDRMCNSVYDTPRETACRAGSTNRQCGGIISGICSGNPFDSLCGSGYTQNRRSLCIDNPFAPRCAGDLYNDLRVSFCERNAGNPACPTPTEVTAEVWAGSFDTPLATEASSDERGGRFLIGRETDLDASRVRNAYRRNPYYLNNLNLADATFNGVALGGDRADGVAFASNVRAIYNNVLGTYAGVLSGTNLGAPLTDTQGSAKWIGSFQIMVGPSGGRAVEDFVLNISFGAGDGAGEIEALIQNDLHYPSDHHITGEFDDAGVITGTVQHGYYRTNDADNRGRAWRTGKLTGLIGEEGAVGAFLMSNYYGGFVARPTSADELRTLEQTCGDDPYNPLCTIGYESERLELIEHCITDDNVNDERCASVNKLTHCIKNPFRSDCEESLPQHHELVLANRIAFCRKAENVDNALCTYSYTVRYICTRHPFSPQCFADSRYNQARERACTTAGAGSTECRTLAGLNCGTNPFHSYCDSGYNNARASACNANPEQQRCADTLERVCNGNPFDTLCRNTTVYLNARKTHCRRAWNDPRCPATIRAVCGVDPFDRMCNSVYDTPRETACRNGSTNTQCGGIIAGVCGGNPFDPLCGNGYTQNRRSLCIDNPFAPRCAGDVYNDLRVSFCERNAGNPACPTPQVTAKVWADSFDEDLAHGVTSDDTKSQFLIGRATDLDTGGVAPFRTTPDYNKGLNLADATFNGVALGGDAADGVAFFAAERANNRRYYSYAGILEGTNLGAPLTDTQGSAKWIGSFRSEGYSPTDFVLNVSFGTGDGAGEIEAIIQSRRSWNFHIAGEFDDAGVITGRVRSGFFPPNDPDNSGSYIYGAGGELTGLIGEEGAVGAYTFSNTFGGFVARPSSAEELRTLEQTCTDDPFNKRCSIGYESERNAILEHCIIGGNANDERCDSVNESYACINNPFYNWCDNILPDHYERARANRVAFCRTVGNADNALCTVDTTFNHICRNYPFDAQCLGDSDYTRFRRTACLIEPFATRCAGDAYNDLRVTFCENNAGNPACPQTPQVTAEVWADSFDEDLSHGATAEDTEAQFLIGRATDLDTGGARILSISGVTQQGSLNLADATFNGVALGGDAADGMAFFQSTRVSNNGGYSYAGILEGTNLGAPLTDASGSAKWIGSFFSKGGSPTDFVLNLSFGTGAGAGELEAIINHYTVDDLVDRRQDFHINGEFDDAGVITGTIKHERFFEHETSMSIFKSTDTLTGLIGEEGAVGAFLIYNWFGGFVARPPSSEELRNLTQTCTDDPFSVLCTVGYESERTAITEHCITGGNANDTTRCGSANERYSSCINDPFNKYCKKTFPDYYEDARANRFAFCMRPGDANNALCAVADTLTAICKNHPFDTRCTSDEYKIFRVTLCGTVSGAATPDCLAIQPSPNRVTGADWLESFGTPLATRSSIRLQNNGPRHWDQFLKGTSSGLDTSGLEVLQLNYTSFANSTFDGQSVGGDAVGGAYSLRTYYNGLINNFASIHSDTDLGAPITAIAGTQLIWHGVFQRAIRNHSGNGRGYDSHTQDFALEINFGEGNKVGTVEAFVRPVYSYYDDGYYYLKGEFDANGVIDGIVQSGRFPTHTRPSIIRGRSELTGLIGQKGAVGAFQGYHGAGGFVATPNARFNPNVRHSDWVNSFDASVLKHFASRENEGNPAVFVRGDETGIHSILNEISNKHFAPTFLENTLDFSDINPALDSADKVSYIATAQSIGREVYFYGRVGHAAGIWPTTDLGLPLVTRPADANGNPHKATWGGKLGLIVNAQLLDDGGAGSGLIPTRDIGLVVDYTNQTIHNTSTIDGAHQVVLNGRWTNNADNSQNGVISGDITYNAAPSDTDSTAYAGVVKGIIGQEGAVGAFVRDGTDFDYVGGFIAHPSVVFVPPAPQVTAAVWADSFDTPLATVASVDDTEHKFLIGRATYLDTDGIRPYRTNSDRNKNLTLADATFNGVALGGDAADGVAFFAAQANNYSSVHSYAGILSGTNLGAPLTDNTGSAKWIGAFQHGRYSPADFILNVSFGTGEGAGEIEAIVPTQVSSDYHVAGEFDDAGVITGTVQYGGFRTNVPDNRGAALPLPGFTGELTGLIGEEGAVGAFFISEYYGGFVARPSSAEELRTVAQTCADDPFNRLCAIGYESERNEVIERCIIGGNANDESCDSVKGWHYCINDPFRNDCYNYLPQHYEQARINRLAFCRTVGNADNALCTVTETFAHICTNHPFDAQCRGDNDYRPIRRDACLGNPFATRCAGDAYNDLRVSFCEDNAGNPACPQPPQATAEVWEADIAAKLANSDDENDFRSKFVVFTPEEDVVIEGVAQLDDTFQTLKIRHVGGVAFLSFTQNEESPAPGFAGILHGTNLGAPLTQTEGSAKWRGSFQYDEYERPNSFILNITFGGVGKAGSIEAIIPDDHDFHIRGNFDDAGVITGTVEIGDFTNIDNNNRGERNPFAKTGVLTGLIGEHGAIGAFFAEEADEYPEWYTRHRLNLPYDTYSYTGGFVARPTSRATQSLMDELERGCNANPFGYLCNIGYDAQRNAVIERCIVGDTANDTSICQKAIAFQACIGNPFGENCNVKLPGYYEQAQANRVEFCRTAGNADNALCTVTETFAHICTNHPFDAQCRGDNDYRPIRRDACLGNPFATRCAGDVYNDLRVSFCDRAVNADNSACPQTPQVTAKVWADSFDEDLAHGATAEDTESKFLIGRETDLDTGGLRPYSADPDYNGDLNLATATFNGVALGGYGTNGVAYFASGEGGKYSYAGILSGTNLGAPLTDTAGSAKWVGSFLYLGLFAGDFVLNLSFGTGEGAGELEAILQTRLHFDIHIAGEFDDTGVITGTARSGFFSPNDPDNRGSYIRTEGELTGLIGEKGAVGAFLLDKNFGVFVARPSSAAERRTLRQTCADDPFHGHCTIGYESERNAILEHCIIGGNANDESCDSVKSYICISEPFYNWCDSIVPDHYQQARDNRVAFCRTVGNAGNALCTVDTTIAHICTNHPFDAQCRGDNDYRSIRRDACTDNPFATRCAGDAYNDLRVTFCENNADNPACPQPVPVAPTPVVDTTPNRVTAADWVDSFDTAPATVASTYKSQFLQGTRTGVNSGTLRNGHYSVTTDTVTLSDARRYGKRLGGDSSDGLAFFYARNLDTKTNHGYVGILSSTDLGAPVTQTSGKASWKGVSKLIDGGRVLWGFAGFAKNDFTLEITFGSDDSNIAGKVTAVIRPILHNYRDRHNHYKLDGSFDYRGVISGTVTVEDDAESSRQAIRPENKKEGILSGLIGQEGAVGVFHSVDSHIKTGFVGGFVVSSTFVPAPPRRTPPAAPTTPAPDRIATAGWVASFNTAPASVPSRYSNQFLQGTQTGLNTGSFIDYLTSDKPRVYSTTFADAVIGDVRLDGDASDGFAVFSVIDNREKPHFYAGILSGTDLGAPLGTNSEFGRAYWKGTIQSVHAARTFTKDIKVEVRLGSFYRLEGKVGKVRFTVQDTRDTYIEVVGYFDNQGVIEGTSSYGIYGRNNRGNVNRRRVTNGILTGLIGEEGVVGVFVGDGTKKEYAGGFIATPNQIAVPPNPTVPEAVTTALWLNSFGSAALPSPTDIIIAGHHFVKATATGLDHSNIRLFRPDFSDVLNLADSTFEGQALGGDAADGFAVAKARNTKLANNFAQYNPEYYYVGILADTDLGAPLNNQPNGKAIWYGSFKSNINRARDFALIVDFGAGDQVGTLHALVYNEGGIGTNRVTSSYRVNGTFDDNGVIRGSVDLGAYTDIYSTNVEYHTQASGGTLTGLIGAEGAVGVFFGADEFQLGNFGGGFVARPGLTSRVTYRDWANLDIVESHGIALSIYRRNDYFTPVGGGDTPTNTSYLRERDGTSPTVIALNLRDATFNGQELGGDVADGVAFFKGWDTKGNRYRHFAGVLNGTDLGAPLTQTSGTVTWNGNFQAVDFDHHLNTDFTLEIAFGVGGQAGTVDAFVQDSGETYFKMNGAFNHLGVIVGSVIYGEYLNGDSADTTYSDSRAVGPMNGLIGQEGAVGVFTSHRTSNSSRGNGYSGGFVAAPPSE